MTPAKTILELWVSIFPTGLTRFGYENTSETPETEFCFWCGGHGYRLDFGPTGYRKCPHCAGSGYGESLKIIRARTRR